MRRKEGVGQFEGRKERVTTKAETGEEEGTEGDRGRGKRAGAYTTALGQGARAMEKPSRTVSIISKG